MAAASPGTATAAVTGDGYRYYAQIRSYLNVAAEGGVAGGSTAQRARKGTSRPELGEVGSTIQHNQWPVAT